MECGVEILPLRLHALVGFELGVGFGTFVSLLDETWNKVGE